MMTTWMAMNTHIHTNTPGKHCGCFAQDIFLYVRCHPRSCRWFEVGLSQEKLISLSSAYQLGRLTVLMLMPPTAKTDQIITTQF